MYDTYHLAEDDEFKVDTFNNFCKWVVKL